MGLNSAVNKASASYDAAKSKLLRKSAISTVSTATKNAATGITHSAASLISTAASSISSKCGPNCGTPHAELWGDVVAAGVGPNGSPGLSTSTAQECCKACEQARGCNTWVWCSNPKACGQQCWLKRQANREQAQQAHWSGDGVPWTSGTLDKDFDVDPATLPPADPHIDTLVLSTAHGSIRIKLRPDWHQPSVEYVRRLAQLPHLCTHQCHFYRAEPGFLLQGAVRGYIPANNRTQPGPKLMERGDIGWAGAGPGPDFFIYLGAEPAAHFGTSHTVWGQVTDQASLAVVERLVQLPATAPKPGDMHMLDKYIPFTTSRG